MKLRLWRCDPDPAFRPKHAISRYDYLVRTVPFLDHFPENSFDCPLDWIVCLTLFYVAFHRQSCAQSLIGVRRKADVYYLCYEVHDNLPCYRLSSLPSKQIIAHITILTSDLQSRGANNPRTTHLGLVMISTWR